MEISLKPFTMKNKTKLFTLIVFFVMPTTFFSQTVESPYEVGIWKGFAKAAVTYTFDDHHTNQFKIAVPLFDKYGFKLTIYPIPDWNPDWDAIRSAAASGHEIGSHTMSHPHLDQISLEEQDKELKNSQSTINRELSMDGVNCSTIAYPYCDAGDMGVIGKYYIAGRICSGQIVPKTPEDYYNISSYVCGSLGPINDLASFEKHLVPVVEVNGWLVLLLHGIDDDGGYSPVTAGFLRETVEYLDINRRNAWVATFRDAVLYSRERDAVSVKEIENTAAGITVEITDNLDNSIYNLPITIRRPLPLEWKGATVTQNGKPITSILTQENGNTYIVFDAVPDAGNVVITTS
jgi:Predicted xylanase/chitin deacetylase